MPLTRPMPEAAFPTADAIRDAVPRPRNLPSSPDADGTRMRWPASVRSVRQAVGKGPCCPIGLHPLTEGGCSLRIPIPEYRQPADEAWVYSVPGGCPFWEWWDEQTDPTAAMNAVWGPS